MKKKLVKGESNDMITEYAKNIYFPHFLQLKYLFLQKSKMRPQNPVTLASNIL